MSKLSEEMINQVDAAVQLLNTGKADQAAMAFTDILQKDDKISLAWNNRGLALLQLGHPFDAVMNIEKAIALEPKSPEYYLNLGACYAESERMDKAIEQYNKSIAINPKIAQAHMNMGNAFKYKGDPQAAIDYYRKCTEADPTYVDGHLCRAFAELTVGNYKEGWDEFEWRWKSNQLVPRGLPMPEWKGEDLTGKTLLVYGEQGHGDSLHFIRYASEVKKKYKCTLLVEVRQPLVRLIKTVDGVDGVITFGEKVPINEIDYCIPVMSLPRLMGTTVETIPWHGPYFKADQYRVSLWRERLKQMPPGLLVGLCWAGMSRPGRPQADAIDKRRSMALENFKLPALNKGVSWVSLQKGPPRNQIMKPPAGMTIGDWSDDMDDFFDTAALIECLDLVITVDTAVVHVAGGLGKPTWMLGRWDGCWRWGHNQVSSPWYPTVRQFVQPKPHDWDSVTYNVGQALEQWVNQQANRKAA